MAIYEGMVKNVDMASMKIKALKESDPKALGAVKIVNRLEVYGMVIYIPEGVHLVDIDDNRYLLSAAQVDVAKAALKEQEKTRKALADNVTAILATMQSAAKAHFEKNAGSNVNDAMTAVIAEVETKHTLPTGSVGKVSQLKKAVRVAVQAAKATQELESALKAVKL